MRAIRCARSGDIGSHRVQYATSGPPGRTHWFTGSRQPEHRTTFHPSGMLFIACSCYRGEGAAGKLHPTPAPDFLRSRWRPGGSAGRWQRTGTARPWACRGAAAQLKVQLGAKQKLYRGHIATANPARLEDGVDADAHRRIGEKRGTETEPERAADAVVGDVLAEVVGSIRVRNVDAKAKTNAALQTRATRKRRQHVDMRLPNGAGD